MFCFFWDDVKLNLCQTHQSLGNILIAKHRFLLNAEVLLTFLKELKKKQYPLIIRGYVYSAMNLFVFFELGNQENKKASVWIFSSFNDKKCANFCLF